MRSEEETIEQKRREEKREENGKGKNEVKR